MNFYDNFISNLRLKKVTVGVIGMGYVGLPLAILAAKKISMYTVLKETLADMTCFLKKNLTLLIFQLDL